MYLRHISADKSGVLSHKFADGGSSVCWTSELAKKKAAIFPPSYMATTGRSVEACQVILGADLLSSLAQWVPIIGMQEPLVHSACSASSSVIGSETLIVFWLITSLSPRAKGEAAVLPQIDPAPRKLTEIRYAPDGCIS